MDLFSRIDELLEQNRSEEAEILMEQMLSKAMMEQDRGTALAVLNEMVGFYRSIGNSEKAYYYGEASLAMLEDMDMKGSIPYATSLLNLATAYRAGGRLEDSLKCYSTVEDIYEKLLDPMDLLNASFCNNVSLLYQEMGDFSTSRNALRKALKIISGYPEKYYEQAVTYTNLANTDLQLGLNEEAVDSLNHAIGIFKEHNIEDSHYCAAVSALGTFYYNGGRYEEALQCFEEAMLGIEKNLGHTESYERMKYNVSVCKEALGGEQKQKSISGMEISKAYYEAYGKKMIAAKFGAYENLIAVGLCGEGSECFGYDDEISKDHDFEPGFCMFLSEDLYEKIGEELEKAYQELPSAFMGLKRNHNLTTQGKGRRGVQSIEGFFDRILGTKAGKELSSFAQEDTAVDITKWNEAALCCAGNGELFTDPVGKMTKIRKLLQKGYPEEYRYRKLAQEAAEFTQYGLYNAKRMFERGDKVTARLMISTAVMKGCHLLYTLQGKYAPHDKWLLRGLSHEEKYRQVLNMFSHAMETEISQAFEYMDKAAENIAHLMYEENVISDIDFYLDHHVEELLYKASLCDLSCEQLSDKIARMEFATFDKVKNEGGRASCQDDWFTFSIMRKSQYYTFDRDMLFQYCYDFNRENTNGHNLIEEKYGRMMESTAPEKYQELENHFPELSEEKKQIIEAIVKLQVQWMEEFSKDYPNLAGNARSIHTYEDNAFNTSYETYLRGELRTYSDKMLELYGKYIVRHVNSQENLAKEIMEHNVKMYGYESLEEAERGLG